MRTELDEKLCADYPDIFKDRHGNMSETCMCWGFECGDGWYDIIDTFCRLVTHDIKYNKMPPVTMTQVKEKFGGLRLYHYGGNERSWAYESFAESMSYRVCELCGNPGKCNQGGWLSVRCPECREKE